MWYRDHEITEKCQTLKNSMPNRELQVKKNGGGHLMY